MMPKKNGYEVCKTIRHHYSVSELPIIFVSAKNRIDNLVLGFESGGNDYVLKPFLREELLVRVEGQVRSRDAFVALAEVAALKSELSDRLLEETRLRQMQVRLTRLLHNINDGLLVLDEEGEVIFANHIFENQTGRASESIIGKTGSDLLHSRAIQNNLMTAKLSQSRFTSIVLAKDNGDAVELLAKRAQLTLDHEFLTILTFRDTALEAESSQISEWVLAELSTNQRRLNELEAALNNIEAAEDTLAPQNALAELGVSFENLKNRLTGGKAPLKDPFSLGSQLMNKTISLWKEATGKEKWEFAGQSGLWKIHPDEDGWQRTVTLDKYLDIRKWPKFPRWNVVIQSANFVLGEAQKLGQSGTKVEEIVSMVKDLEERLRA